MYMQVPAAGNGIPQAELAQERVPVKAAQPKTAEVKTAEAAETINKSLPEGRNETPPDIMADLERITVAFNKKLKFEVNHHSNEIIVKVLDPETDKVIKVLPPEELQRLHSRLKETIGFLFDERI
ncbi:MAG: flagellar protein FlaG [Spirochaetaceae bacterium]|jgi:flagellar protein FlaG|nr:flagellar protein FlaG [Spirochaetaceae bacterium]